jgi:hypothetical protein
VQDLVALGVRLEQAVLDPVVHHLDVVAGAGGADVREAVLRSESAEDRLGSPDGRLAAADHQAVAVFQPPDAPAGARVHQLDAAASQGGAAPDGVVEIGVSAVDDDVAPLQSGQEQLDGLIDRLAGRHHEPDDTRRREAASQVGEVLRALRAIGGDLGDRRNGPVPRHDFVSSPEQAPRHVAAHPAETHHREFHVVSLSLLSSLAPLGMTAALFRCWVRAAGGVWGGWGWRGLASLPRPRPPLARRSGGPPSPLFNGADENLTAITRQHPAPPVRR